MDKFKKELSNQIDATERRLAGQFEDQGPKVPTEYMRRTREKYLSAPLDQQFAFVKEASGAQTSQQLLLAVDAYEEYWSRHNGIH